jgi:hypothetical protein
LRVARQHQTFQNKKSIKITGVLLKKYKAIKLFDCSMPSSAMQPVVSVLQLRALSTLKQLLSVTCVPQISNEPTPWPERCGHENSLSQLLIKRLNCLHRAQGKCTTLSCDRSFESFFRH